MEGGESGEASCLEKLGMLNLNNTRTSCQGHARQSHYNLAELLLTQSGSNFEFVGNGYPGD